MGVPNNFYFLILDPNKQDQNKQIKTKIKHEFNYVVDTLIKDSNVWGFPRVYYRWD